MSKVTAGHEIQSEVGLLCSDMAPLLNETSHEIESEVGLCGDMAPFLTRRVTKLKAMLGCCVVIWRHSYMRGVTAGQKIESEVGLYVY